MTATNIFFNFVGFRYSPALRKSVSRAVHLQHTTDLQVVAGRDQCKYFSSRSEGKWMPITNCAGVLSVFPMRNS